MGTRSVSPTRLARGRSYWIKQVRPASAPGQRETQTAAPAKRTRFVEPYRFDAEQRRHMLQVMEQASLGDDDSRTLFLAALEYDVAHYRQMAPDQPPAPQPRSISPGALEPLAAAAELLAQQLASLSPQGREPLFRALQEDDQFRRSYGQDYLAALHSEIDRLARACTRTRPPPAGAAEPPLTPAGKRFIALAANAFSECFESSPSAGDGTFVSILAAVIHTLNLPLPTEVAGIEQALSAPPGRD